MQYPNKTYESSSSSHQQPEDDQLLPNQKHTQETLQPPEQESLRPDQPSLNMENRSVKSYVSSNGGSSHSSSSMNTVSLHKGNSQFYEAGDQENDNDTNQMAKIINTADTKPEVPDPLERILWKAVREYEHTAGANPEARETGRQGDRRVPENERNHSDPAIQMAQIVNTADTKPEVPDPHETVLWKLVGEYECTTGANPKVRETGRQGHRRVPENQRNHSDPAIQMAQIVNTADTKPEVPDPHETILWKPVGEYEHTTGANPEVRETGRQGGRRLTENQMNHSDPASLQIIQDIRNNSLPLPMEPSEDRHLLSITDSLVPDECQEATHRLDKFEVTFVLDM